MDARDPIAPLSPARAGPRAAHGLLAALILCGALSSRALCDTIEPEPFLFGLESAAFAEGPTTLLFNPAGTGTRYPKEFSFSLRRPESGGDVYRTAIGSGQLTLGATLAKDRRTAFDTGVSGGHAPLRFGFTSAWIPKPGGGRFTDHRLGLQSRPRPWLLIGAIAEHLTQPKIAGVRIDRVYTVGLAVRPLGAKRLASRGHGGQLTLAVDALLPDGFDLGLAQLRYAAEVEPVPGFVLRGTYLAQDRAFRVGISVLGVRNGYHAHRSYDRDRDVLATTHTLSFHEGEDRTVLKPRTR